MGELAAFRPPPLDAWRGEIVDRGFRVFAVIGGAALLPSLWLFAERGRFVSEGLPYTGLYAAAIAVSRMHALGNRVRGGVLSAALVIAGAAAFLSHGFYSDARIVFLSASVFATVLLGWRWGIGVAVLAATLVGLGGAGVLHVATSRSPAGATSAAAATMQVVFIVFAIAGIVPIGFVLRRFETALREEFEALERATAMTRSAETVAVELERGRGLLEAIIQNAPAVVFIKDREGRYQLVNEGFSTAAQLPKEAIVGRTDAELPWVEIAERARVTDLQVMDTGEPLRSQEFAVPPAKYVTVKFPIRSPEGEIHGVGGIATDILELEQGALRAEESEARHRAIFEGIWHALLITTESGRVVAANFGASRLFGFTQEELLALTRKGLAPISSDAGWDKLLEAATGHRTADVRAVRKDGSEFDAEVRAVDLPLREGRHVLMMIRDVSTKRDLERRRRVLNAELEARVQTRTRELEATNRELEAFSYSVSHDLRAPLRHVAGYVGLLREHVGTRVSLEVSSHLDEVSQAASRMARLIDDLLRFARVGRTDMTLGNVAMDELAREVVAEAKNQNPERRVVFSVDRLPVVHGDRAMLRQVLVNLVSNALKFSRVREEAHIDIGVAHLAGESDVVLFVKDDGIGFDPRYAAGLFGVFQRLHPTGEFEGTGVGLAHVKSIVSRHGGRVWAESSVGGGATFFLTLKEGTS